jgi:hypothetical protein
MSYTHEPSYITGDSTPTLGTRTVYNGDPSDYSSNETSAESGSCIWTAMILDSVWIESSKDIVRVLAEHQVKLKKDLACDGGFLLCEGWLNDILNNLTILGGYLQDIKDPILMHDCRKAVQRFDDAKIELQVCTSQENENQEIRYYMCRSEERQQRMAELEEKFKAAIQMANGLLDDVISKVNQIGQRITEISD